MSRKTALTALLIAIAALAAGCKPSVSATDASPAAKAETAPAAPAPAAPEAPPATAQAPAARPALPPEACTREGSREFLQQFVESADVRRAYSKLDLKAGVAADVAAAHPQFDGFRLGLVDSRWVLVDPSVDPSGYPRVVLKSSLQGDTFTVDYTRARFSNGDENVETYGETSRYTFEFIDGCWALASHAPAP